MHEEHLTYSDLAILKILNEREDNRGSFSMFVKKTKFSLRTVSLSLKKLLELGYIIKDDFGIYQLTDKGRKLLEDELVHIGFDFAKLGRFSQACLSSKFSKEDLEEAERTLKDLMEKLKDLKLKS